MLKHSSSRNSDGYFVSIICIYPGYHLLAYKFGLVIAMTIKEIPLVIL